MLGAAGIASECRYMHADDLTEVVTARLWQLIDDAVTLRDEASLILAGGSTPVPIYNLLRELPMPWDMMRICPSDERWVDAQDPASNEGMLRRELIKADDNSAQLISMARQSDSIADDALHCEAQLAKYNALWDVVVLGMGADGHTASLFPGSSGLKHAYDAKRSCVPIVPTDAAHSRLTLTPRVLLHARRIILLLSGQTKWQVYQEALAGTDTDTMPVRVILHQEQVPVDVYWSA